jgi:uncharacterized membrane protein
MARGTLRWLGIVALLIGYPLLAHYTNQSGHSENLGALVAVAPVLLIALVLSCVALSLGWPALERHFGLVYWLQNMAMYVILFITFARTLIAGRQPLCTRFAAALQAPLTPRHEIYTRQVTLAWSLFFAAMALASSLLFFLAPLTIWSIFANFLTLPLVALMFVAEYGVRRYVLPEMRNMHILDAVRAYRNKPLRPR